MSGIKISSKRAYLGLGGNHSNLVEDEGLRRRPSSMEVTKHQGEVEETYGNAFELG